MDKILISLFLVFAFVFPAMAYIDPGTGSMLFSIALCSVATIFFVAKTLILKIKSLFFFDKNLSKNKQKFVIYSEGKQYYCVFKPIIDEFEKRKIPLMYYTSSEDDLFFEDKYEYIKGEYIGKGNKAYFKLAFLNADICLMTTPQLDVLQLKRSKNVKYYVHIFHAIGFSMGYRLFGLDYYDAVLCDAGFQIPLIRELEKKRNLPAKDCIVVGSTYMDYNRVKIKEKIDKPKEKETILLAPSWGDIGFLSKYGEDVLAQLQNTNYNIIVRPHPQSLLVEKDLLDSLRKKFAASKNIFWDFLDNNADSLAKATLLISDFSSIMLDFAFLCNKPFAYIKTNYNFEARDSGDLDEIPWYYNILKEIGKELDVEKGDLSNLVEITDMLINDDNRKEKIKQAKEYAWANQGLAAQKTADFLIKKQIEFEQKQS